MYSHQLLLLLLTVLAVDTQIPAPKCECVASSSGQPCLQYDSRLQAVTLQEAMASFPDLTITQNETDSVSTLKSDAMCTAKECLDCHKDLQKKLKEIGMLAPTAGDIFLAQSSNTSDCKKYRFARKDEGVYLKDNKESSSEEYEDEYEGEWQRQKKIMKHNDNRYSSNLRRIRRQTITALHGDQVIGTRFVLSCSTKGVTVDSSGFVSFCSSCWVWRRLPDNYLPQYINELLCDKTDNACLSGYARCDAVQRTIEVVRNDSGVLTTVALTAGYYCECRIAVGSALQSLVTGNGPNSAPIVSANVTGK